MSDDMAAEQREPKFGLKWKADLHRLDADGQAYTVVEIVGEDAWSVTESLRAAARTMSPPPGRLVPELTADDERELIAALDAAHTPPVVSPGRFDTRGPYVVPPGEGDGRWMPEPPVVSPGGIRPETGLSATQSAEQGSARGMDTPGASGGAQGAATLRADGEPMRRRPRSRTVSGQTVTNSYLHAINKGNRMTLGGVKITPREIQVVFVDGHFEKMILIGWRGPDVVWTRDCGWELPEDLRELTDPAQCDVETVMERRERRERRIRAMAGPPPVVSGVQAFHAALDAAANGRTPVPEPDESWEALLAARKALMIEVGQLHERVIFLDTRISTVTASRDRLWQDRNRLEQVCEALAEHVHDAVVAQIWPERPLDKAHDRYEGE